MTLYDLQQIGFLKKEIAYNQARLQQLRERSLTPCIKFGEQGGAGTTTSDPVGKTAAQLAELERLIERHTLECISLVLEGQRFIMNIHSAEMRIIMTERYIRCKSWQQVANAIGEHDEQIPRMRHNRFIVREISQGRIVGGR